MTCILGIESSCDETGVAIYDSHAGIVGNVLHSQIAIHATYGGVVPEIASRDHVRRAIPLVKQCLEQSGRGPSQLDAIAYTAGPGLIGALMVGASVANALAWSWDLPCIPVHHMEAHLLAPLMGQQAPEFPFLALLVSGGHSLLIRAHTLGQYEIIGQSLDDAVGEAFDKTAKILGLGYPGGPAIEAHAQKALTTEDTFPRPMLDRPGYDFSFSGLKTHALLAWKASRQTEDDKIAVAAAFQHAVIDTLVEKCRRAVCETQINRLIVAGGVSANRSLRAGLEKMAACLQVQVIFPSMEYCTDNGAMIAYAGYLHRNDWPEFSCSAKVRPRWPIDQWRIL